MLHPKKLSEGVYELFSFKPKKILKTDDYEDLQYQFVIKRIKLALTKAGISDCCDSHWGPDIGDKETINWHVDRVVNDCKYMILCMLSNNKKAGTKIRTAGGKVISTKPWTAYLLSTKLDHRGPDSKNLRICIRYYLYGGESAKEKLVGVDI